MSIIFTIAGVLTGLVALDIALKQGFGLGRPLLYKADPEMGYRVAPNQITQRFGNRIRINEFSMRNDPINPRRSPQTLRMMMLGDSLVNGMVWTDQEHTLTAFVQRQVSQRVLPHRAKTHAETSANPPTETHVEVLNVAAGSWGPRNEWAYLQRFGLFESQLLILVLNTDDFFGGRPRPEVVGRDPNYPDRYPLSALAEVAEQLYRRVGLPGKRSPLPVVPLEKDVVEINLKTIAKIYDFSQTHGAKFILVLSPLKRELECQGGSRDYEQKLRQQLQDWVDRSHITYLNLLPLMNAAPDPLVFFSDHIHLSQPGNQFVSEAIVEVIDRHF